MRGSLRLFRTLTIPQGTLSAMSRMTLPIQTLIRQGKGRLPLPLSCSRKAASTPPEGAICSAGS